MQENTVFSVLNALNCNEHTEKKGSLTYLSWAWQMVKSRYQSSWRQSRSQYVDWLPGMAYEARRAEAPPGARRSVSEMRSIEAAETPAGTEIPGQAGNDVEAACPFHRGLSRSDWGFE